MQELIDSIVQNIDVINVVCGRVTNKVELVIKYNGSVYEAFCGCDDSYTRKGVVVIGTIFGSDLNRALKMINDQLQSVSNQVSGLTKDKKKCTFPLYPGQKVYKMYLDCGTVGISEYEFVESDGVYSTLLCGNIECEFDNDTIEFCFYQDDTENIDKSKLVEIIRAYDWKTRTLVSWIQRFINGYRYPNMFSEMDEETLAMAEETWKISNKFNIDVYESIKGLLK